MVVKSLALPVRISMYTAFAGSIITPALETIRRWHQLTDPSHFINWFDDYLIGGFLFFAAWKTYKAAHNALHYLSGAWGFATGFAFASFVSQLQSLSIGKADPAPVSSATVAVVKGIMLAGCVLCLVLTMRSKEIQESFDK
jgi:hypothetical protein